MKLVAQNTSLPPSEENNILSMIKVINAYMQ